jgi:hypothetical protein
MEETYNMRDLGVDEGILLKYILRKYGGRA